MTFVVRKGLTAIRRFWIINRHAAIVITALARVHLAYSTTISSIFNRFFVVRRTFVCTSPLARERFFLRCVEKWISASWKLDHCFSFIPPRSIIYFPLSYYCFSLFLYCISYYYIINNVIYFRIISILVESDIKRTKNSIITFSIHVTVIYNLFFIITLPCHFLLSLELIILIT